MLPNTLPDTRYITAEVLFFSAQGTTLPHSLGKITPETLESFEPAAEAVEQARAIFEDLGFDVLAGGFSLTISGPLDLFEQTFQVAIDKTTELPVPQSLEGIVESIVPSQVPPFLVY